MTDKQVIVKKVIDNERDEDVGVPLSKYNLNYVFAPPDTRDQKFSAITAPDTSPLPSKVDLRPTWGEIFDQGEIGSCVSNSVSYCLRYCLKKQKMKDFTPSRLFIYYNGRVIAKYPVAEDTGLTIRDGYKSVSNYSACSEKEWEYVQDKFAEKPSDACYSSAKIYKTFRYVALDNDLTQMKRCLKDGYPISFGALLFSSFMTASVAKSGIVPAPTSKEKPTGGHALTLVGYDDSKKAFLVANSWSSKWGIGGFCWMPYSYLTNDKYVSDLWSPRLFS